MPKQLYIALLLFFLLTPGSVLAGQMEDYGILDVKNHQVSSLPKLKGDGVTDETANLQKLIDYAYLNRLVVLLPEGNYLVSNTITLTQNAPFGQREEISAVIVGSTKGSRPSLVVPPNSKVFADSKNPQPVLFFKSLCNEHNYKNGQCSKEEFENLDPDIGFRMGVKNISINVKAGNPGAIGISHPTAQNSFIQDVDINLDSGYAGIDSLPGVASVIGGITITGGKYGITGKRFDNPAINNIRLINQTDYAVYQPSSGNNITFVGLYIKKQSAPAIKLPDTDYGPSAGMFNLIDTVIEFSSTSNQPAIDNSNKRSLNVQNLYIKGTSNLITGSNPATYQQASSQFAYLEYYTSLDDQNLPTRYIQDGQVTYKQPNFQVQSVSPNIDQVLNKHSWGLPDYSPDHLFMLSKQQNSLVCDIKSSGATGDKKQDITSILQSLIDDPNCQIVYLPKGEYRISSTVTLKNNTHLQGGSLFQTRIVATDGTAGKVNQWKPTGPTIMVDTIDQKNALISLRDLGIFFPSAPQANDWFTGLRWRAGPASLIKSVEVRPEWSQVFGSQPKSDVIFTGNGGGRWFGANSIAVTEVNPNSQKRRFTVENTTTPLYLYNYNIEDGQAYYSNNPSEGWQSEFINSQNIYIFGSKFEDRTGLRIKNSRNIAIYGYGGRAELGVLNSDNIRIANAASKTHTKFGSTTTLQETRSGQSVFKLTHNQPVSLFTRGQFDQTSALLPTVFDYRSKEVPNPTSSPTPTPTPVQPTPTPKYDSKYDLNGDNKVTVMDIIEVIKYVFQ